MYAKQHIESKIMEHFASRGAFSRDELLSFLRTLDSDIKESTFNNRIFDLKKRHRIKDIGKGIYTLEQKQQFQPEADGLISKIGSFLETSTNYQYYNVWTTAWLNELIELQATSLLYILEVDKMSMEYVFYSMKDSGDFPSVFINPDDRVIENYISELPKAVVIAPMITRAPTIKVGHTVFPSLEKILVDLFCDPELYFAYQGQQLLKIFEAALSKYIVNYSRLLNYAKRRNRDEALKTFLQQHPGLHNEVISILE